MKVEHLTLTSEPETGHNTRIPYRLQRIAFPSKPFCITMPKSRFALLDVIAAKQQLLGCVGYRVNNIYDINDKTYAFKLHQTGQQKDKKLLLMESGIRFHLTSFSYP